jgi:lipopolysaccharide transport system ATP-binding protein
MYVRLAFAVAAHLEPDILVIDEVLAVGDSAFQKKCLGKMGEVSREGRTILFVSHNMTAIQQLCERTVFLEDGRIHSDGLSGQVVSDYLGRAADVEATDRTYLSKCGRFQVRTPFWIGAGGERVSHYLFGEDPRLRFEFTFLSATPTINPGIALLGPDGARLLTSHLRDDPRCRLSAPLEGKVVFDLSLGLATLAPGRYSLIFGVRDENEDTMVYSEQAPVLEIRENFEEGAMPRSGAYGLLWHTGHWTLAKDATCRM